LITSGLARLLPKLHQLLGTAIGYGSNMLDPRKPQMIFEHCIVAALSTQSFAVEKRRMDVWQLHGVHGKQLPSIRLLLIFFFLEDGFGDAAIRLSQTVQRFW
jgi:hypothetical protein